SSSRLRWRRSWISGERSRPSKIWLGGGMRRFWRSLDCFLLAKLGARRREGIWPMSRWQKVVWMKDNLIAGVVLGVLRPRLVKCLPKGGSRLAAAQVERDEAFDA